MERILQIYLRNNQLIVARIRSRFLCVMYSKFLLGFQAPNYFKIKLKNKLLIVFFYILTFSDSTGSLLFISDFTFHI